MIIFRYVVDSIVYVLDWMNHVYPIPDVEISLFKFFVYFSIISIALTFLHFGDNLGEHDLDD